MPRVVFVVEGLATDFDVIEPVNPAPDCSSSIVCRDEISSSVGPASNDCGLLDPRFRRFVVVIVAQQFCVLFAALMSPVLCFFGRCTCSWMSLIIL